MIGLGVGIDYALFILTRFREAFRTPGPTFHDVRESVLRSIDTAGRAVLFAGTTVVIALLGMMLLGVDFLYGVAISASIGVLLVMLASLTLLPALLTMAGEKVAYGSRRRRRARGKPRKPTGGPAARTALERHGRQRAPRRADVAALEPLRRGPRPLVALLATVLMLAIAAPAIALRLGSSDASNDPSGQTTHKAYELLAEGFGQGFNGPLLVAAKVPNESRRGRDPRAVEGHRRRRLGRSAETQRRRGRRDDHRLPGLLAAGLRRRRSSCTTCATTSCRRSRRAPAPRSTSEV